MSLVSSFGRCYLTNPVGLINMCRISCRSKLCTLKGSLRGPWGKKPFELGSGVRMTPTTSCHHTHVPINHFCDSNKERALYNSIFSVMYNPRLCSSSFMSTHLMPPQLTIDLYLNATRIMSPGERITASVDGSGCNTVKSTSWIAASVPTLCGHSQSLI